MVSNNEHNIFEEQANTLHQQLKQIQEENRRLQQQLLQKGKHETNGDMTDKETIQQRNLEIVRINILI
jgi:hypothetical protein